MSDLPDDRTDTYPPPPVHYEHYCEHPGCEKWGSWGYAAGRNEMRWFCFEHRPEKHLVCDGRT